MLPSVHVETLRSPDRYSFRQIQRACKVAMYLARGKFVLCEEPEG